MRDFVQIINRIDRLEEAVKIKNFNCGFDSIDIEFNNSNTKGIASLYFKLIDGEPELTDCRLIIDDPRLICMREFYKATASQVLLRWNIQRGIVAIPKSVRPERLLENSQLYDFELSNTDIDTISDMNRNERRNFDPDKVDSRPECMWPKIVNL